MIILELDEPRWLGFVESCSTATPFHHPTWARLLAECYGYRPFALALTDSSGQVVAGIPVVEVSSFIGQRRWLSLPFTDSCPPLALSDVWSERLVAALDAARREAGIASLEVRAPLAGAGVHCRETAVSHALALTADPQAVYQTFKRSQVQRNIRKAEREGVQVRRGDARSDLVDVFYQLHLLTRQRQGTPVQPRRFFELLWTRIIEPGLGHVLLAYVGDNPVAGAVFLTWNGTMIYKFGASDPEFWKFRPNHPIFWDAIRWGCEQGFRTFDFGRTDFENEGLRDFKSGWGAQEEPLVYATFASGQTRSAASRTGSANRAIGTLLQRSPQWVCRVLGELLYKYAA